jgi:predicted outer membrane protein
MIFMHTKEIIFMKRYILIASLALTIMACNDAADNETASSDSLDQKPHQMDSNSHMSSGDTSGMMGKSMMTVMQGMMSSMKSMQSTGNPDNDFAALMKTHHLGAIEMAELEMARGSDETMKQMARKMADDQQKEVAELNTFLSGHSAHGGGDAFFKEAMGIMNNMNMEMDHSGSMDHQFAQMMIPHHQTAIDMVRAYLKGGGHEEKLKAMANNIASANQKEINDLRAWMDKNK